MQYHTWRNETDLLEGMVMEPQNILCLDVNLWAVLDTLPESIALVDLRGTTRYLNASWYQFMMERAVGDASFTIGQPFVSNFASTFRASSVNIDAIEKGLQSVLSGTSESFEMQYSYHSQRRNYWFTTTILATHAVNGERSALIRQRDTTAEKHAEQEANMRNAILEALGVAGGKFLQSDDIDGNINFMLEQLGRTTNLSRVYVFHNHTGDDGNLLMSQRYEWCASDIDAQIDNPDLQNIPYNTVGFQRWVEILGKGEAITGSVSTFPETEREILEPQHILYITVVPIFVDREWWGFIGFDNCVENRPIFDSEIGALKTAASIIGSAILNERNKQQQQQFTAILEATTDFVAISNAESVITFMNRAGRNMLQIGHDEIISRVDISETHPKWAADLILQVGIPHAIKHGVWQGETVLRARDGSEFPVLQLVLAHKSPSGEIEFLSTIARDISELKDAEAALEHKSETIRELSTPIIPLNDRVMVMPIIGTIDEERIQQMTETLLNGIAGTQAETIIIDCTGIASIDYTTANGFIQAAQAARLLGAQTILTGIRPDLAQALVSLDVPLQGLRTYGSLQAGITHAMGL